jgi:YD repeat-containing protein
MARTFTLGLATRRAPCSSWLRSPWRTYETVVRNRYDGSTSPTDPHWAVAANAESRDSVATDAQGYVTSVTTTRGATTVTQTMTYDGTGHRKVLRVTNGSWTDSLVFINDTIQYPLDLPDFGGKWTEVRYLAAGPVDSLRYPTGGTSTRLFTNFS